MDDAPRDADGYGGDTRARAARLWQGAADGAVSYLPGAQTELTSASDTGVAGRSRN